MHSADAQVDKGSSSAGSIPISYSVLPLLQQGSDHQGWGEKFQGLWFEALPDMTFLQHSAKRQGDASVDKHLKARSGVKGLRG